VLPALLLAVGLCQPAVAKQQVMVQPSLRPLVETVLNGGGVDTLLCGDFTHDGRLDMAFTVFSGGTAGDTAWIVLRRTASGWRVALKDLQTYKVRVQKAAADLVETTPVYLQDDPNCCPTGGFDHRRFRWNGRAFAVFRTWHTKN